MAKHAYSIARKQAIPSTSLNRVLTAIHAKLRIEQPTVSRMAVALYDNERTTLKTYLNSTYSGHAITHYSAPIDPQSSLGQCILRNSNRSIGNIRQDITSNNEHSVWLRQQPYQSSLTVPLFDQNSFVGVLFYNASDANHFDRLTQQGLYEYSQQVLQLVQGEWDYLNTLKIVHENIKHSAFNDACDSIAHSKRVGLYSEVIANQLADRGWLDDETLHHIAHCAALHDIGKYSVLSTQHDITWEPSNDTTDNLKKSVKHGANVLSHYASHYDHESHPSSHLLDQIIRYHHCYLDGSGYPRNETPPLVARIVTVANIFDALTSDRTYCQPWSVMHALLELEKKVSQGKIDSLCVDALRSQQQMVKSIMDNV